MITNVGLDLVVSNLDPFSVTFEVTDDYILQAADVLKLSIKATPESTEVLHQITVTGITGNLVTFTSADIWTKIKPGQYSYDVLLVGQGILNYPALLTIRGVCHD